MACLWRLWGPDRGARQRGPTERPAYQSGWRIANPPQVANLPHKGLQPTYGGRLGDLPKPRLLGYRGKESGILFGRCYAER
jgi:hypothetical protein